MSLASLNAHGGRDTDRAAYDLAAACRQLNADVIALQEVWHPWGEPDPVEEIASAFGAEVIHADLIADTDLRSLGISGETTKGRWGLAVLTTMPVDHYDVADPGRIPGDPIPRVAQLVTLETPGGGKLRLANTHLTHTLGSPIQLFRLVRHLGRPISRR